MHKYGTMHENSALVIYISGVPRCDNPALLALFPTCPIHIDDQGLAQVPQRL